MTSTQYFIFTLFGLVLLAIGAYSGFFYTPQASGSVIRGGEYQATTTAGAFQTQALVKSGQGVLGSVVITANAGGTVNVYDATTTDVNKRTGNTSTSSIYITSLPASSEGTYTFDVNFFDGLLVEFVGERPTTTITWR